MTLPTDLDIFLAFAVHHEAVREHAFVGRAPAGADAFQKRGVKPAAVLVVAFQVHVAGRSELRPLFQHGRMADARVEPDVENIYFLGELRAAAVRAKRVLGIRSWVLLKPDIRAVFFHSATRCSRMSLVRISFLHLAQ